MFSLIHLGIVALVLVAGYVVYKLWKSGKAVTPAAVVSGVESTVSTVASDVKSDVTKSS